MIRTLWLFISVLPDLLKLVSAVQKAIDDEAADRKLKADLQTLHEAFSAKDASKINALFTSK